MEDAKTILGKLFDVAANIGTSLGKVIDDAVDRFFDERNS